MATVELVTSGLPDTGFRYQLLNLKRQAWLQRRSLVAA